MPSNRKVSFPATTSPALAVGDCAPRCSDPGPSVARAVATWKDAGRHGRRAGCAELSLGSPSFSLTSHFISQDKSHGHSWRPGARAEQSLPPTARRTHRGMALMMATPCVAGPFSYGHFRFHLSFYSVGSGESEGGLWSPALCPPGHGDPHRSLGVCFARREVLGRTNAAQTTPRSPKEPHGLLPNPYVNGTCGPGGLKRTCSLKASPFLV